MGNFLCPHMKEKRYLAVLDDIWKIEDWKYLADIFPKGSNGSRLLITTWNKDVALHADTQNDPHEMQLLSNKESWELFCRITFPENVKERCCPPELKKHGEKMVEKCAGFPSAIVVLGGLLSRKKKLPNEWAKVQDNIAAHLSKGKEGVDAMLSLSYIHLPHYLKSYFLYFSLFPGDNVISTRKLLFFGLQRALCSNKINTEWKT